MSYSEAPGTVGSLALLLPAHLSGSADALTNWTEWRRSPSSWRLVS
jgi:hypothetical protein